ncbi:MAG: hypothetical protein ACLGJC_17640 [Alphaproteobacteria bacterium]
MALAEASLERNPCQRRIADLTLMMRPIKNDIAPRMAAIRANISFAVIFTIWAIAEDTRFPARRNAPLTGFPRAFAARSASYREGSRSGCELKPPWREARLMADRMTE